MIAACVALWLRGEGAPAPIELPAAFVISHMLGGRDLTSVTLKHVREMIEQGAEG